jgi:hypothetical protein
MVVFRGACEEWGVPFRVESVIAAIVYERERGNREQDRDKAHATFLHGLTEPAQYQNGETGRGDGIIWASSSVAEFFRLVRDLMFCHRLPTTKVVGYCLSFPPGLVSVGLELMGRVATCDTTNRGHLQWETRQSRCARLPLSSL